MGYAGANAWQAAGQGLRGIGNLAGGLRREREEDERLRAEEERRRGREGMLDDIALSEIGGGRGAAPTVTETIPTRGAPRRPDLGSGPLFPEPGSAEMGVKAPASYMPEPDFGGVSPVSVETTDRDRYRSGGKGEDAYYFEKPDFRRSRLAGEDADRASEERAATIGRLGPGIDRIASGDVSPGDDGYGNIIATGAADGLDLTRFAPAAAEPGFDPETDPSLRRLRERAANPELYGEDVADAGTDRGSAAWMRMRAFVDEDEQFFDMPAEEKNRITDEMMAGTYETPEAAPESSGDSGPSLGSRFLGGLKALGRAAVSGGPFAQPPRDPNSPARVGPDGNRPPAPGTQPPTSMADQPTLDEAANHYRTSGNPEAAMREDEWTPDEIEYMLESLRL